MLIELCLSVACFAAEPEPPAAPVSRLRRDLAARIVKQIHVRVGLGDGRGAARLFTVLDALSPSPGLLTDTGRALLDVYDNLSVPRDIRARLVSEDAAARRAAAKTLAKALRQAAAEHKLPRALHPPQVLGTKQGCPVTHARAFAAGPRGTVVMLSDGLVIYDGRHWQVVAGPAIRLYKPIQALFVDSKGRTWLGSAGSGTTPTTLLGRLRRFHWSTVACFGPAPRDLVPGRWHVLSGADRVSSFAESKQGVWIASHSRLFRYDGEQATPVNSPLPYSPRRWLLAAPDSDHLWVVDVDRLSHFDGARWRSFNLGKRRPRGALLRKGQPVVLLEDGLLLRRNGRFERFPFPRKLGKLAAMTANSRGEIWCVTEDGSLVSTGLRMWRHYGRAAAGDAPRPAPAIFCDRKDRVWLSRGRGVEVGGALARAERTYPATPTVLRPEPAPLVSAAGAGGWLGDGLDVRIPKEEKKTPPAKTDFSGFPGEDVRGKDTVEDLLEELRRTTNSGAIYLKLCALLRKTPDAAKRAEVFRLAASGQNRTFFSNPVHVRDYAEVLLDQGAPAQAYILLIGAWDNNRTVSFRKVIEPALFEALVAMGFGEFARPAFLRTDVAWAAGAGRSGATRHIPPIGAGPALPGLWAPAMALHEDVGTVRLKAAGLHRALILAAKRWVLASAGDPKRWTALVDACVKAGDVHAARRYRELTRRMFALDAVQGEHTGDADSVALSPLRWVRRLGLGMDSALPLVVGGNGWLCVYDEGPGVLRCVDSATGRPLPDVRVRGLKALLSTEAGLVALRAEPGGRVFPTVLPVRADVKAAPIRGLSAGLDGFSVSGARKGIFYCFDGGLTRVDLNAGTVTWRNPEIVGGVNLWRSLLSRSLPVADGEDVFVVAGQALYCVAAATGKIRWVSRCQARGTPAVVGGIVVVGSRREVWGLDRRTGKQAWRHITSQSPEGILVTDGVRVFYATLPGRVAALVAGTGEFLWRRPTDIGVRRPASSREKPTALRVRGRRLVACNKFGYVEFAAKTGAALRRLDLRTARPMAATRAGVVVAVAPHKLVTVADPPGGRLAESMLALAEKAARANDTDRALGLARLVLCYVDPAHVKAHELALTRCAREMPERVRLLYPGLLAGVDPFTPKARALMRDHLKYLSAKTYPGTLEFALVAKAHLERGAVRHAARALAAVGDIHTSPALLRILLKLQLAAGDKEAAAETVRRLSTFGVAGAAAAVRALAAERMEEEALDVALRFAERKDNLQLVYLSVVLSISSGLFEKARDMLDRSPAMKSASVRGQCLAHLLSNAGASGRALDTYDADLRRAVAEVRAALIRLRDRLRAQDRARAADAVDAQIERLKKADLP